MVWFGLRLGPHFPQKASLLGFEAAAPASTTKASVELHIRSVAQNLPESLFQRCEGRVGYLEHLNVCPLLCANNQGSQRMSRVMEDAVVLKLQLFAHNKKVTVTFFSRLLAVSSLRSSGFTCKLVETQ